MEKATATASNSTSAATDVARDNAGAAAPGAAASVAAPAQSSARVLYRFDGALTNGRPAAIPASFSSPSAADETLRSVRIAPSLGGGLSAMREGDVIELPLPDNRTVSARVNFAKRDSSGQLLVGGELLGTGGSFSLGEGVQGLGGVVVPNEGTTAYALRTGTDLATYLLEKRKGSVVCVELPILVVARANGRLPAGNKSANTETAPVTAAASIAEAAPEFSLSSRPTAPAVAYLDFDGENVTDSGWNGGSTINAAPSGLSADQIIEVWRRVAEDYRPFNIDVTTDRSRYDSAPVKSRMRCIITQTSGWYSAAGGVAYIGSWSLAGGSGLSSTVPCWVFANMLSTNPRYISEAASHEIGHTLGLSHDGLQDADGNFLRSYYSGHGAGASSWAPIMGSSYTASITQWSKGDYSTNGNVSNNTEDDLAIIADAKNRAGYMSDDTAGTRATASALRFSGAAVSTIGTIERTGDVDMYAFTTSGGAVTFTLVPEFSSVSALTNADTRATLYDGSGNVIADSNPTGSLFPSISTSVGAGTFYLAISGVGEGAVPGTGYSSYGSVGRYEVTGSVVTSVVLPPVVAPASARVVIGLPFTHNISASNSPTSYAASGLPANLVLNGSTGLISGSVIPTFSPSIINVTVYATNSAGTGSQTLTLDLKTSYSAWSLDGGVSGDSAADADGDGMNNLMEYAFNLAPAAADTAPALVATVYDNGTPRLEVTFTRPSNRPDLIYTVEVSSNLTSWTAGHAYGDGISNGGGLPTAEVERSSLGAAGERIRVRDIGGSGNRFIRVRVSTL